MFVISLCRGPSSVRSEMKLSSFPYSIQSKQILGSKFTAKFFQAQEKYLVFNDVFR